jgi:glycosyltransferase involved in cell wall biosynthesis
MHNPRIQRIAYFAVLLDGPISGAAKKVLDQAAIWRNSGVDVTLFIISNEEHFAEWAKLKGVTAFQEEQGFKKLILRHTIVRYILKLSPEILYIRDSFPFIIPRKVEGVKLILEVQTLLRQELQHRSTLRKFQSVVLDNFYLSRFSKFVFVSHEIGASKRFKHYVTSENSTVVSNGILLEKHPELRIAPSTARRELFFIGQNGQSWHGIEQILELARSMPNYVFNVVGVTDKYKNAPSNVIFHGVLAQNEYLRIAEKCVLGIGTLNLKAKGMTEGSSLKVREYLAMGLPVFLRHTDTDFMDCPSYILELPNDDTPITRFVDRIVAFAELWSDERVPRSKIARIDMKEKELQRLEFILGNSSSN